MANFDPGHHHFVCAFLVPSMLSCLQPYTSPGQDLPIMALANYCVPSKSILASGIPST